MSDNLAQSLSSYDFSIDDLINEVIDEIKMRRYVYPNQVLKGTKTSGIANRKIAAMEEILLILKNQRDGHIIRSGYTLHGHPILIECQGMFSPLRAQNLKNELKFIFEKANDNKVNDDGN